MGGINNFLTYDLIIERFNSRDQLSDQKNVFAKKKKRVKLPLDWFGTKTWFIMVIILGRRMALDFHHFCTTNYPRGYSEFQVNS